MNNKVSVTKYSNPHYHAGCRECGFSAARNTERTPEPADVRNAVRKHVRKTGHTCWIESGNQTIYSPLEEEAEPPHAD